MGHLSLLVLTGVLGIFLTACQPPISFSGDYMGTRHPREAAVLAGVPRGTTTVTVMLTQTGMNVSGTYQEESDLGIVTGTIAATVTTPGVAAGGLLLPPPPALPIHLFLTATTLDLVFQFDGGDILLLERQP